MPRVAVPESRAAGTPCLRCAMENAGRLRRWKRRGGVLEPSRAVLHDEATS